MTLADAIRKSNETGCEFWRGDRNVVRRRYRMEQGRAFHRLYVMYGSGGWTLLDIDAPVFTASAAISDDWQVEQTAPHGEGM